MKFSLLGVFIAIVAATTPCFHTNQELWNELTSTLPALCAAHGNTLLADRVTDVYPYVGPEPMSLPVVHVFRTPPPPRDDVSNAGAAFIMICVDLKHVDLSPLTFACCFYDVFAPDNCCQQHRRIVSLSCSRT